MQPDPRVLDRLIQTVVTSVRPLRIILFGSAARGEMRTESDLDVAVVVPEGFDPHMVSEQLYPRMVGMGVAVEIVVTTPEQLARHQSSIGMLHRDIGREGRELYAA